MRLRWGPLVRGRLGGGNYSNAVRKEVPIMPRNFAALMHELGPEFAARAARFDDQDLFVAENYVALKKHGVLTAGIPAELAGSGAEHRELSEMLRVLARYCSSTALASGGHRRLAVAPRSRAGRGATSMRHRKQSRARQQRWL